MIQAAPRQAVNPVSTETLRIEPVRGWSALELRELLRYKELIYFFIWREIKVRYKQTVLGASWAILQPLLTMLIFTLFFGRLAKMPSDGIPYAVFVLTGIVPWSFFANSMGQAANSVVGSANLITKVYFPRLAVPVAAVLSGLVDLLLSFALLVTLLVIYRVEPNWNVLFLPFFVLLATMAALGTGLWLAALNVAYRDVRHIVPFLTQIWMFATPIVYPASLISSEPWRTLYGINPMVGVIDGFRWSLLGSGPPPGSALLLSVLISTLLLVSGAFYFRRVEREFADII